MRYISGASIDECHSLIFLLQIERKVAEFNIITGEESIILNRDYMDTNDTNWGSENLV